MAPEIHLKKAYKGQEVDLFAIAIILFIMVSGHPPFEKAKAGDRFYKFLNGNRDDVFWRTHSRNKQGGYSDNLKNLLTTMWQPNASQRLTTANICGHPWMQEPVATIQEVQQEFGMRNEKI